MEQKQPAGLVLGLIIGLMLGLAVGAVWTNKQVRRGWILVPVVAAAQDLPEGTVVTFDQLVQRSVPEQFVTTSVVKPEAAEYIVNQKLLVPMKAGDLMLWSHFESNPKKPAPSGQAVGSDSAR